MSAAAELLQVPKDPKSGFFPFFEYAPVALVRCDGRGKITASNSALDQILGNFSAPFASRAFVDLIHPDDRYETQRLLTALSEGRRDCFQIETRTTNGNSRSVRWAVWRVDTADAVSDGFLATAEEIPGTAAQNERLRQSQRLESIGRLAGGVAHDFNNLLTGVLLYCDLLIAGLEPTHRARKYAEEIRKAGLQATGVVRQLLALAKPANCQPRLLSLNEIAEGMRDLLGRLIGGNIDLKLRLDPQLGLVRMDPSQLQQILLNLVLNSRDAMPTGGTIRIETGNCKVQVLPTNIEGSSEAAVLPCALLVVADNGQGMDESTRAHIFEPFFTTKGTKGTGLGLATVHDIVSTNGGLLYVDSKPGAGTRISVLLPLVPRESFQPFAGQAHLDINEPLFSSHSEE